jgi:hypothetical protein
MWSVNHYPNALFSVIGIIALAEVDDSHWTVLGLELESDKNNLLKILTARCLSPFSVAVTEYQTLGNL